MAENFVGNRIGVGWWPTAPAIVEVPTERLARRGAVARALVALVSWQPCGSGRGKACETKTASEAGSATRARPKAC